MFALFAMAAAAPSPQYYAAPVSAPLYQNYYGSPYAQPLLAKYAPAPQAPASTEHATHVAAAVAPLTYSYYPAYAYAPADAVSNLTKPVTLKHNNNHCELRSVQQTNSIAYHYVIIIFHSTATPMLTRMDHGNDLTSRATNRIYNTTVALNFSENQNQRKIKEKKKIPATTDYLKNVQQKFW